MKNVFLLLSLFLFANQFVFAQSNQTEKLRQKFKEVEFEKLYVHSSSRVPATYPATSLYAFKGTKLDNTQAKFFKESLNSDEYESFYATYRFKISDNIEGWLLRACYEDGLEHHIFQFVYDKSSKKIIENKELAHHFGYEGGFGIRNSLILDINKDGKPDLLTYTWFESSSYDSELDGLDYQEEDSLILSVWNQGKMISQTVIDTVLQKELMRFFPTEGENSVDAHLENKLVGLLENDMKVEVSKFYNYKWGIVIGSDKTLEAAHFEGEKAKKLLQSNKKNNFRWNNLAFYSKTNRYYTVFSTFKTKEDAEKALPEIKKLIRKDAYIINEKKWCPKFKYNKNLCECD
jgi:hypothetical protein